MDEDIKFLRGKLYNTKLQQQEAYERTVIEQEAGGICRHCDSPQGHYARCPLLNRVVAEERSRKVTADDEKLLHDMKIKW